MEHHCSLFFSWLGLRLGVRWGAVAMWCAVCLGVGFGQCQLCGGTRTVPTLITPVMIRSEQKHEKVLLLQWHPTRTPLFNQRRK